MTIIDSDDRPKEESPESGETKDMMATAQKVYLDNEVIINKMLKSARNITPTHVVAAGGLAMGIGLIGMGLSSFAKNKRENGY